MKNQLFSLLIFTTFVFVACENPVFEQEKHTGHIEGTVYINPEATSMEIAKQGITIKLIGLTTTFETETDSEGNYNLGNLPVGDYTLIVSKSGYGEKQEQEIRINKDEASLNFDFYLKENSSTLIENLSATRTASNNIHLRARIIHNIRIPYYEGGILFYLHSEDNLSHTTYTQVIETKFFGGDHFDLVLDLPIEARQLKDATEFYLVAYGFNAADSGYYDIQRDENIITSLGHASEIIKLSQ